MSSLPPFDGPGDLNVSESGGYMIRRKGSLYNIIAPDGRRVFAKFKSASIVGPRWEELTHTPWPYPSSAYESGLRLWELGVIERGAIGQRELRPRRNEPVKLDTAPAPSTKPESPRPVRPPAPPVEGVQRAMFPEVNADDTQPVAAQSVNSGSVTKTPDSTEPASSNPAPANMVAIPIAIDGRLALPAPRIDLGQQRAQMAALKRDPNLLFQSGIRQVLQTEVDYNLPQSRWAQKLLMLLTRYEKRQRAQRPEVQYSSQAVTAKHIAWQEAQAFAKK